MRPHRLQLRTSMRRSRSMRLSKCSGLARSIGDWMVLNHSCVRCVGWASALVGIRSRTGSLSPLISSAPPRKPLSAPFRCLGYQPPFNLSQLMMEEALLARRLCWEGFLWSARFHALSRACSVPHAVACPVAGCRTSTGSGSALCTRASAYLCLGKVVGRGEVRFAQVRLGEVTAGDSTSAIRRIRT